MSAAGTTSQGSTRTALLAVLAGVLLAGGVVWQLVTHGSPGLGRPPASHASDAGADREVTAAAAPAAESRLVAEPSPLAPSKPRPFPENQPSSGVAIIGRVEVDGHPPRETIRIGDDFQPDASFEDDPDGEPGHSAIVSASGAFELDCLKPDEHVRLKAWTAGYRIDEIRIDGQVVPFEESARSLAACYVAAPATGVVVKMSRLPVVRGRAVSQFTHLPIPRACGSVELIWDDRTETHSTTTGRDGSFAFAAGDTEDFLGRGPMPAPSRVELTLNGPDRGTRTIVLDPTPGQDRDLGDVEVPPGRVIRFIVRDPAGAPIEGALAREGCVSKPEPSSRTDSQGRGSIHVLPRTAVFTVGALKYEIAEVPIPAEAPDPVPIVLRPASGIEVHILPTRGADPGSMLVQISAEADMFRHCLTGNEPPPPGIDTLFVGSGASSEIAGSWGADKSSFLFRASPDGRVIVAGLEHDVPLKVAVLDPVGLTLETMVVTLGQAEWKTVEMRVTQAPRKLHGRVQDATGMPIAEARVMIDSKPELLGTRDWTSRAPHEVSTETDQDGRFALPGILHRPIHLAVEKNGYVPLLRRDFAVPAGDPDLVFELQRGVRMKVKLLESDGAPIRDAPVWIEVPGYPKVEALEESPGCYAFADLPPDANVRIHAKWADQEWRRPVTATAGHIETITMPPSGRLLVDYSDVGEGLFVVELWKVDGASHQRVAAGYWQTRPLRRGAPPSFEAAPVMPGEYEATLRYGGFDNGGPDPAQPQTVTIRAGETTRIVFKKPQ